MVRIENNCVGCERCYHCGRDHVKAYICDKCGNYVDSDELYDTDAGELCKACMLQMFEKKFYGDFEDQEEMCCEECGDYAEDFYNYHGMWLCEDCMTKQYNKVSK